MSPYSTGNSHRYYTLHGKNVQHHMATIVDIACQGHSIFNVYHQWCKHLMAVLHGENIQHCMARIFDVTWRECSLPAHSKDISTSPYNAHPHCFTWHGMARILKTAKRQKSISPGEDSCHSVERMYSSKWRSLTSQRS